MSRLPTIDGDDGTWGTVLNDYLSVSLNADGTTKDGIINVKTYGATGDGTTDDTAAINTALAAATAGSKIFFPVGTYIVVPDGTGNMLRIGAQSLELFGAGRDGSIIKVKASAGNYESVITNKSTGSVNVNISGFRMRDLTIDENSANNTISDVSSGGPLFTTSPRYALRCFNGFDGVIENCRFTNCDNVNTITINGGSTIVGRWAIRNSLFDNTGDGSAHDHSSIYFHGTGLVVRDCTFIGTGSAPTTAIETHGPNQIISGNQVTNFLNMMNITGVSSTNSKNLVVTNNTGSGLMVGIQIWAYDYGTLSGFAVDKLLIQGNQIELDYDKWYTIVGFRFGIALSTGSTGVCRDVKILNNQITYVSFAQTPVSNDNYAAGVLWLRTVAVTEGTQDSEIEISNNTIVGSLGPGILYMPNILTRRVRISKNLIVNPGMGAPTSTFRVGVMLDTSTLGAVALYDVEINENMVVDENGTHKVVCAIDSQAADAVTRGRMIDNTLRVADSTALPVIKNDTVNAFYCRQDMATYTANTGVFEAGSRVIETSTGNEYIQLTTPSGSSWSAFRPAGLMGKRFKAGFYYSAPEVRGAASLQVPTQNLAYFVPFYVSETATFDRIGIRISTNQASTNGRLAIYADDGHGAPGTLVLDAGTVDTATSATSVEATISQQLNPGLYWLACVTQGGTTQPTLYFTITPTVQVGAGSLANASTGVSAYSMSGVSGAYGTYSAAGAVAFAPVISMRVASVP